jgi:uncharacterized membrane protein YdjX (TVP38/TMEM64 family)
MFFAVAIAPWQYASVLATMVGLGLPAGVLVVGAGALFGPRIGIPTVLAGEAIGLVLNWHLCRSLVRSRIHHWLERHRHGQRLGLLLQQPAGPLLIVFLRLAAIPMNLVNAACALGSTRLRHYALASLVLVPRFSLMVLLGAVGAAGVRGAFSPLALSLRLVALLASTAALVLLGRGLRRRLMA